MKLPICLLIAALMVGAACRKSLNDLKTFAGVPDTRQDSLKLINLLNYREGEGYLLYLDNKMMFNSTSIYMRVGAPCLINPAVTFFQYTLPASLVQYRTNGDRPSLNVKITREPITIKKPDTLKLPSPDQTVFTEDFQIKPGSRVTNVVFYEDEGIVKTFSLETALSATAPPAKGNFKLRVANFGGSKPSPQNPYKPVDRLAAQLQFQDSSVVSGFENIPFATVTDYKEFDYNSWQFKPFSPQTQAYFKIDALNNLDTRGLARIDYFQNYPFVPGGVYTLLIARNTYSIIQDRLDGPGTLDEVSKVQLVNAVPGPNALTGVITCNGKKYKKDGLLFGSSTLPTTFDAGPIQVDFINPDGSVFISYSFIASRLSNNSLYVSKDQNGVPFVFEVHNSISSYDYTASTFFSEPCLVAPTRGLRQAAKVNIYNLAADVGKLLFTNVSGGTQVEAPIDGVLGYRLARPIGSAPYALVYSTDRGLLEDRITQANDNQMPSSISAYFSINRNDNLAGVKVASIVNPVTEAGTYSLVVIGLYSASDAASKIRLIIVPHTNNLTAEKFIVQ